jgi:hypothetical protein
MANREERMVNGEWRVARCELRVASGARTANSELRMEKDREWRIANGEWKKTANSELRIANGEW